MSEISKSNNIEELLRGLHDKTKDKNTSGKFCPIEVTIKDTKNGEVSSYRMKNVILIGVLEDDERTIQAIQGVVSICDIMVLTEVLKETIKRIEPQDKLINSLMDTFSKLRGE